MSSLSEGTVLSQYGSTYDTDMDSFFNLEQLGYQAPDSIKSNPSLTTQSSYSATDSNGDDFTGVVSNAQSQMLFSGPSHQYDDHQQQTGLPTGALAHAMAFSTSMPLALGSGFQSFNSNGEIVGTTFKQEDAVNFASTPARNPSRMSVDSAPAFFRPSKAGSSQRFIDPTTLDGLEISPISPPAQVGRMYPGMHRQQAAMAQAAQQQRQLDGQARPQQRNSSGQMTGSSRQPGLSKDRHVRPTDPIVEERISRLLQQMKDKAVASQQDLKQTPNSLPQIGRLRKDEDDMDEDERLLASEEGKKLSSKERRQLRNKVSARAFRSRRKEYIGQLEGEVAAKTNEAHELRSQNRALLEENKGLADLARTLLSSPHFSSFLDELANTGSSLQQQQQPQQPEMMQRSTPSNRNAQVGMVMVPEPMVDISAMDITSAGWNSGIDMNFTHAPVFAVLEVPEGPALDTLSLSGKSSNFVDFASSKTAKDEAPCLDLAQPLPCLDLPVTDKRPAVSSPLLSAADRADESLALFLDDLPAVPHPSQESPDDLFSGLKLEKSAARYSLIVEGVPGDIDIATRHRFARLCASIEAPFERISLLTAHLS